MSYNPPTLRVLDALGIADKRLPVGGGPGVLLDGVLYFVNRRSPTAPRGDRKHRLMARCWCGKTVSAGRIGQHSKVHAPSRKRCPICSCESDVAPGQTKCTACCRADAFARS